MSKYKRFNINDIFITEIAGFNFILPSEYYSEITNIEIVITIKKRLFNSNEYIYNVWMVIGDDAIMINSFEIHKKTENLYLEIMHDLNSKEDSEFFEKLYNILKTYQPKTKIIRKDIKCILDEKEINEV